MTVKNCWLVRCRKNSVLDRLRNVTIFLCKYADDHVVEIAVSAGIAVLIVALIVIWLVRRRQDNNGYENINGQNGVEESDNEFPDTSEGTSGRGSESVTRLSPMGSSCSDITAPKKQNKDNLNSKIKTYTDALCWEHNIRWPHGEFAKICDFSHPISHLTQNSIPYFKRLKLLHVSDTWLKLRRNGFRLHTIWRA